MSDRPQSIDTFVEKELNDAQRKAVTHASGPVLVTACAGSGKTRVITARIAYMIASCGAEPASIVALTFTNKAAREMRERIVQFLGDEVPLPFIGTFHSYCLRLLKRQQHLLEHPSFSIIDEDDQKKMVQAILQRNNLQKQVSARGALYQISQAKNGLIDPDDDLQARFAQPLLYEVFQAYESEKRESHAFDFDDLLIEGLRLFKKQNGFQERFQEQVRHLLVDEYQDTNLVQHELLKQMAKQGKKVMAGSICAVGDEDQSIYSWRGATVANIGSFRKDFPGTKLVKIEQNYRSVQPILDVAGAVIKRNTNRIEKKIWSGKEARDRVRVLSCVSEYQEAAAIAAFVQASARGKKKNDVAVLYRTHAQSRVIEEQCIRHSIPYKIIGGVQFYERKEVKDVLAHLRLVANPFDRTAFFRIINTPARGLGPKFEEQFYTAWHDEPFLTFRQIGQKLIETNVVKGTKAAAVTRFLQLFDGVSPKDSARVVADRMVGQIGYVPYLKDAYEPNEAQSRIDNIKELLDGMAHFESNGMGSVELFLEEVALIQERISRLADEREAVLLMTLHAAKGLEFDGVILAGLEEGLLPAARSMEDDDALEEERRLFYVGITRARERLLLTRAKYRYTYGQMTDQFPSQFLSDVPSTQTKQEDCTYWNDGQFADYFEDWFGVRDNKSTTFTYFSSNTGSKTPRRSLPQTSKRTTVAGSARPTAGTSSSTGSTAWRKNRTVKHKTYGMGVIQAVEQKGDATYVTVHFAIGRKKIISRFLQLV